MMRSSDDEQEAAARGRLVEVAVPPGPLGILLDDAGPGGGAYLDGFAAVGADESERGAVELSGRVPAVGSVLVRVNQYDLEAEGMGFTEIGQLLRDTSHLPRTLGFRVPNSGLDSEDEEDDSEEEEEEEEDSDEEELETDEDTDVVLGVGPVNLASPAANQGPAGVKALPVSATAPVLEPTKGPALVPSAALSSAAGRLAAGESSGSLSPSSMATLRPSQSLAAPVDNQDDDLVRVQVPPGPLGLNLNGAVSTCAEVLGFVPLPGGQRGAIEAHGGVLPGSRLVEIDGEDVSPLALNDITILLGERGSQARTLGFRLPPPAAPTPTARLPSVTALVENPDKRRRLEAALVLKHDAAALSRGQCWFMLSTAWLARWVAYAAQGAAESPGPVNNDALLADGWRLRAKSSAPGRPDVPRPGLVLREHYRAVTPMVWCLFAELHGEGDAPPLPRFALDIYAAGPSDTDLAAILREPRLKAAVLAGRLRDACRDNPVQ